MSSVLDRFRLEGRVALVTGGSKGLGEAMASALAEAGADLVLTSRHEEEARATAGRLAAAHGRRILAFEADVSQRDQVAALVRAATAAMGHIDILVNNAGINIRKPTLELSEEEWRQVVDINLTGPFLMSKAVAPGMLERRWGRIINLGSIQSFVAIAGRPAYNATKGGLMQLTRTMALEWAQQGVNVNCICPGPFDTPLNRPLRDNPEAYQAFLAKIPLGRWGDPSELGPAVVFLASEAASFITGAALMVDGGWTVQ